MAAVGNYMKEKGFHTSWLVHIDFSFQAIYSIYQSA